MQTASPPAWRTLVSSEAAALYDRSVEPFARFIPAYEALANEAVHLRHQNAELERQLGAAREAAASAAVLPSGAGGGGGAATGGTPAAAAAQLVKLQSKVLELQDAVTSHYKAQADGVRERLALSEGNQRLREEARVATAERDRAVSLARAASSELALVKDALVQRESALHTLEGELQRTRAALDKKCTEADALRADNDGFVERFMAEQGRNVEEVNAMNALVDAARRERDVALGNFQGAQRRIAELSKLLQVAQAAAAAAAAAAATQGGQGQAAVSGAGPGHAAQSSSAVWGPAVPASPPSAGAAGVPAAPGAVAAQPPAAAAGTAKPAAGGAATGISSWFRSAAATITAAATTAATAAGAATGGVVGSAPGGPQTGGAGPLEVAPPALSDCAFAYTPLPTRAALPLRPSSSEINAVRFGESSALLFAGSADGCVHVLDARTGSRAAQLSSSNLGNSIMCVDVGGSSVIGGGTDRSICVWDLATQRLVRSLTGHNGKVHSVLLAATADPSGSGLGRGLVLSGGADRVVKVWDLRDGRCLRTIDTRSIVNSIMLSSDGAAIAVGNQDGGVRLFDVRNGAKLVENLTLHTGAVTGVQYSRADGGARLLTTSRDNTLSVCSSRTLEPLAALSLAAGPHGAGAAGGRGAHGGGGDGPIEGGVEGIKHRLAALAAGDFGPSIAATGGPSASLGGGGGGGAMVTLAAASAEAPHAAAAARPAVLRHASFRVPVNWGRGVWSPNGMYAACGSGSGYVCTWSVDCAVFELELGNAPALRRREKAAARLARAASAEGAEALALLGELPPAPPPTDPDERAQEPHGGRPVYCVDWSPDGRLLASGDEGGGVVVWSSE